MKEIILVLMAFLGCNLVNGGSLLAVQSFGPGYPNFHIIKKNDDGSLSCGTYKCRGPPHYCKIETKSDTSLLNLVSTIECKNKMMQSTNRWTLNQKSPKPGMKITIMTEADVTGTINNKKNLEVDQSPGNMNMQGMNQQMQNMNNQMQGMNNLFNQMAQNNPFMNMNNGAMTMG